MKRRRIRSDESFYDLLNSQAHTMAWLRGVCTRSDAVAADAWLKERGIPGFSFRTFYAWKRGAAPTYQMLRALLYLRGMRMCFVDKHNIA